MRQRDQIVPVCPIAMQQDYQRRGVPTHGRQPRSIERAQRTQSPYTGVALPRRFRWA